MSDERIDYVVVISKDLKQSRKFQYIIKFIKNLEELGLKLEVKHQKVIQQRATSTTNLSSF